MYSDNTQTLMTSAELKDVIGKSRLGKLSTGILPSTDYLGVKFKVGAVTKVYDGDAVTGNYYFKTSDGMVKVNTYGSAGDVSQSELEVQIALLPGNTGASDFEYLSCNKSANFDPLYSYTSSSAAVGRDTLQIGSSLCSGDNSVVNGSNLYIAASSSYVGLVGGNSVVTNSSYVIGTAQGSTVTNVKHSLFSCESAVLDGVDSAIVAGVDGKTNDVSLGIVAGSIEHPDFSAFEAQWCNEMGVTHSKGTMRSVTNVGRDNKLWGSATNIDVSGDSNNIGWFPMYMTDLPGGSMARAGSNDITVSGDSNWLGYDSNRVSVYGNSNYIAAGSSNVIVFGNSFNVFDELSGSKYNHASGTFSDFPIMTAAEFKAALDAGTGPTGTVIGNSNIDYTKSGSSTTFSIVANQSGMAQYVSASLTTRPNCLNIVESNNADIEFDFKNTHYYDAYPVAQKNDIIFGNGNSLPSNVSNTIVFGDNIRMVTARVDNCVFATSNLCINGPKYMRVGDTDVEKNILTGVWWVDTNKTPAGCSNLITGMNATEATPSFTDAFVFINSTHMYNGRFFGTVTKDESETLGFGDGETYNGTGTLDGISSYINNAPWYMCKKPDTSMIYAGGIALYGGATDATRNQSGYGVIKLGNMYYHDNTAESEVPVGTTVDEYRRYKTKEYIRKHINGEGTYGTTPGVFKNSVIMTPGTEDCPYAGLPLVVQERQELDGSFHIGVGKIATLGVALYTQNITALDENQYVQLTAKIPANSTVLMTVGSRSDTPVTGFAAWLCDGCPSPLTQDTKLIYDKRDLASANGHAVAIMFTTDREYDGLSVRGWNYPDWTGVAGTLSYMIFSK